MLSTKQRYKARLPTIIYVYTASLYIRQWLYTLHQNTPLKMIRLKEMVILLASVVLVVHFILNLHPPEMGWKNNHQHCLEKN